jgi:hypothetical protein
MLVYNKDTVRTLHVGTDYSTFKAKDNVDVRTSSEMLPSVSNDTGIVSTFYLLLLKLLYGIVVLILLEMFSS